MQAGHNVSGNRTKRSKIITLRPDDEEWTRALSPTEQATFARVDRIAYAPVWILAMISKDVLVFIAGVVHAWEAIGNLLVLDELCTADPRRRWRELADFR